MPRYSTSFPPEVKIFHYVEMNLQIIDPGSAAWDGKYVVVDDEEYQGGDYSGIYRVKVKGKRGIVVGSAQLTGGSCEGSLVFETTVARKLSKPKTSAQLIGANSAGVGVGNRCAQVEFWKYPSIGEPAKTLDGPIEPVGVTLSYAQGGM